TALTLIDMAGRQIGRDHSRDDGSYHLSAPAAGHYVLIAHAPGHQPHASTVELGPGPVDFDVILSGSAGVTGVVRSTKGEPVDAAVVTVTSGRGEVVTSRTTESDGRYEIRDLASDQYTLVVSARNFRPVALLVEVPTAGTAQQDFELVGGANLQGVARAGEDRRPLPDARVSLIDAQGNVVAVVRTDDEGTYSFQDMPAGEYTVIATSYPPVTATVSIDGGQQHEHNIELGYPAGDEQPYTV
ncbi:MAG TPA: carboxypeptidase-like regulatory domain-containing protein, partial [Mycobacteriales bacterium]|nr:carboxypeptidase-like regulatory domain-containing protein [Mycobacteriales bacterium]